MKNKYGYSVSTDTTIWFKDRKVDCENNAILPPGAKMKDCLDCGMCCGIKHFSITPEDVKKMPPDWIVYDEYNQPQMKRHPNGRCFLQDLATNKCTVYTDSRKPAVCDGFDRGQHLLCWKL
jgi:hypothetical protein